MRKSGKNAGSLTIDAVGEGIQCDTSSVVITGGTISVTSTTDKGILAYGNIEISGGYVCAYSTGNDGIDANGNIYVVM